MQGMNAKQGFTRTLIPLPHKHVRAPRPSAFFIKTCTHETIQGRRYEFLQKCELVGGMFIVLEGDKLNILGCTRMCLEGGRGVP